MQSLTESKMLPVTTGLWPVTLYSPLAGMVACTSRFIGTKAMPRRRAVEPCCSAFVVSCTYTICVFPTAVNSRGAAMNPYAMESERNFTWAAFTAMVQPTLFGDVRLVSVFDAALRRSGQAAPA